VRALVFDGRRLAVEEKDEPALEAGHAIVRVHLAGVCNTDLEIARGYMGFSGVLGHEFVGHVEEGPEALRGKRVVGEINFACGVCDACRHQLGRHCPTRRVMGILDADGAFAERVSVPVANLHVVPDSVSDEAAVFTEPLAAAFEILEQGAANAGQRGVVLGDGKLGLLVAQVLHGAGVDVLAVGRHTDKLALLEERGVRTCLESEWNEAAPGKVDLVVEATGSAEGFARAMAALRPRGTLVLKSTIAEATELNLAPLVIDEINLVGSRCGPFEPALAALETGSVAVGGLISERYGLANAQEALRRAAAPGVLKVLVEC
jgi:threonine dehydrogenase-like Zn-dependent dehydrogenase